MRPESIAELISSAARLGEHPAAAALLALLTIGLLIGVARLPPLGLTVLIVGSLIVPLSIGTGTQTKLNFTVVFLPLLVAVWLLRSAWRRDWQWLRRRHTLALGAFAAAATLSFVVANVPALAAAPTASRVAQLGGLAIYLLSAAAFVMAADQIRDVRWLRWMTTALLALGALYIFRRVVPTLRAATVGLFQPGSEGSLLWTWVIVLAFAQAAFNRRLGPEMRIALATLVVTAFYVAWSQNPGWAGGWFPPLIALGAALWVGAPRAAAVATLAAAVAAAWKLSDGVELVVAVERYSLHTRTEAARIVMRMVAANPLLGLGPANYYHSTPLHPILGWSTHFSSHNTYIDLVAQTGLIGFACFAWFVWLVGRGGWRLRDRVPAGFAYAYVVGCLGGLAGTLAAAMIGDWLFPFVYNVGLQGMRSSVLAWLFLGGLMALERFTPTPRPPS